MKRKSLFFRAIALMLSLTMLILISSCSNSEIVTECLKGQTYGFWWGLWHGIIAPVDLVLMLFRDDITVYAQNNNGAWYALGFIIGSGGWGFLGGKGACRKKK
jgi:hypothetical protein